MEVKVSQRELSVVVLHGVKSSITYQKAAHEEERIHCKVRIPDRLPNKLFGVGKGIVWICWNRKIIHVLHCYITLCYIVTCASDDARIHC